MNIEDGNEVWNIDCYFTPEGRIVLYKDRIYVATHGAWFCLDNETGFILYSLDWVALPWDDRAEIDEKRNQVYLSGEYGVGAVKAE